MLLCEIMKCRSIAFYIFICSSIAAAADYRLKTVKVLPIESYPARKEISGIIIAADPYSTNEKSYTAFDIKRLNSRGYFPLHVIIKNNTSMYLNIATRNIVLITGSGQHLYATPAALVVDDVVKAGLADKTPKNASKENASPLSDFTSKELLNRTIDPNAVIDGFLFFFNSNPRTNIFKGGALYIPKLEEDGAHKAFGPISIPLDAAISATAKTK